MKRKLYGRIKVLCENCGTELLRFPCNVRKAKHIFCQLCCAEYNRERMKKWNLENNKKEWHKRTALKLEKHPNYKGLCKRKDGYIRIAKGNNTRKLYHRFLMETRIGRELLRSEVIHHKDGNPSNNNIENLKVMNQREHALCHDWGRKKEENIHPALEGK